MTTIEYDTIVTEELTLQDVEALNENLETHMITIVHVNIKGLKTNYKQLEIMLENFIIKSDIIVCSESRYLEYPQYYKLKNYKMYYNEGSINGADGVVIYFFFSFIKHLRP